MRPSLVGKCMYVVKSAMIVLTGADALNISLFILHQLLRSVVFRGPASESPIRSDLLTGVSGSVSCLVSGPVQYLLCSLDSADGLGAEGCAGQVWPPLTGSHCN